MASPCAQTGPAQMPQILFDGDPDFRIGFAWAGEALARGIYLHPGTICFICAALEERDVAETLAATDAAFAAVKKRCPRSSRTPSSCSC